MKIEFDLPDFEKELNINITIRRDGEVVYSTASSSSDNVRKEAINTAVDSSVNKPQESSQLLMPPTIENPVKDRPVVINRSGNMMNLDDF